MTSHRSRSLRFTSHILGEYTQGKPGPLTICVGGMHGNEPASIYALSKVLETLERKQPDFAGKWIGLVGNTKALEEGKRYIERDLNRLWTPEQISDLRLGRCNLNIPEHREQKELLELFDKLFEEASGPIHVVDMHTSSSESAPFGVLEDHVNSLGFAKHFPIPLILGIENYIQGSLVGYLKRRKCITLGFEAGQHHAPNSLDYHEAFVWTALFTAGNLQRDGIQLENNAQDILYKAGETLPSALEICYRHVLQPENQFVMKPGFLNFQTVHKGQKLATDENGPVLSPYDGKIFLPLYQGKGSDGFFICREYIES